MRNELFEAIYGKWITVAGQEGPPNREWANLAAAVAVEWIDKNLRPSIDPKSVHEPPMFKL